MKIAAYNLLKGGKGRGHWACMLEEQGVDLLLVQESAHPSEHLPPLSFPAIATASSFRMSGRID